MTITELITKLGELKNIEGDLEVCGQSHGCCQWPHEIIDVVLWDDEDPENKLVMIKV